MRGSCAGGYSRTRQRGLFPSLESGRFWLTIVSLAMRRLQLGGLRLDSRESILKGGKSGPAIVAGDPDKSLLIRSCPPDQSETQDADWAASSRIRKSRIWLLG